MAVTVSAVVARRSLVGAEEDFEAARDAAGELDVEAAGVAFESARDHTRRARRLLSAPHVRLAASVPGIGANLEVPLAIARGGVQIASGGRAMVAAVEQLPAGAASLRPADGQLPAGAIARLARPAQRVADAVEVARARVQATPSSGLLGTVAEGRRRFLHVADAASRQATTLADVARVLPDFLGHEEPRRYFLAAGNPAELRGRGGYLGSYTIATFVDGRLEVDGFRPLSNLPNLPTGTVPPPEPSYGERVDVYGGTGVWKNLNLTLDFPTAAQAYEALWEATFDERLDGMLVVDPFAFEALVEVAGPVALPDGSTLEADDVVSYVANQAYEDLGAESSQRQVVLGDVATAALSTFLGGGGQDLRASLDVFGELVLDDHVLLHSADSAVQSVFEQVGLAGRLRTVDGDFLATVVNSSTNAKVDYYAQRRIAYDVTLQGDGYAVGTLAVTVENDAPTSGQPQHVIGPNREILEAGENRFLLTVYGSDETRFLAAEGGLVPTEFARELGHPVADSWLQIPSGEQGRVALEVDVPGAWEAIDGQLVYRLTIQDQVTIQPTTYAVRVAVPEDFTPARLPEAARVDGDDVVWERTGERGDADLEFRFDPVGS